VSSLLDHWIAAVRDKRLLLGPMAGVLLFAGIAGLGLGVPGYSHVRQTVSEIGEVGSPMQIPFTLLLCLVAGCLLIFALGVRRASDAAHRGRTCAYLIACMALSGAGVGLFAFPHPLHNVFGQSELIGYKAPLAMALNWRKDANARTLVMFSLVCFAFVWLGIALNLTPLDRHGAWWPALKPQYGLVQRSLFLAGFGWAMGAGWLLWRRTLRTVNVEHS
jgi:hypothetical membrane protein